MRKIFIITGPIGSGKSSACKVLKRHGYKYINSDKFAKEIIKNNINIKKKISKLLNMDINLSKRMPWKKIRDFISLSMNNKKSYDAIVHDIFYKRLNHFLNINKHNYVIEIPLVETIKKIKQKKITICILANYKKRKERFTKNKHKNESQFCSLNNLQKSREFYMKNSDYVVNNNREIEIMTSKLISIVNKYQ